jgi:hypothetical protein
MGLFFTLLYILNAYLAPDTLFGALVEYRVQLIIAILALIASIPSLQQSTLARMPQTYALMGMWFAVFMSFVFNGLTRSAPEAMLDFLPSTFAFFLVVLNCKTKRHLQMVILVLLSASLFAIYMGYTAILAGNFNSPYLYTGHDATTDPVAATATTLARLRGLSIIHDPNDFAQLLVSLIPCLFFFWASKKFAQNFIFVLVPAGILLFGMFLTHSRGGMLAFLAAVIIAARRKIGTIPSAITAGVLFAIASVVGWSGGRDISVEQGADRMEAWATGLQLLKSHPIFGVGFLRFTEYYIITAHNTIVVCAAELGMLGLFFWVMFLIPSIRDAAVMGRTEKSKEELAEEEEGKTPFERALSARAAQAAPMQFESTISAPNPISPAFSSDARGHVAEMLNPYFMNEEVKELPEEELRRLARLMVISFTGFLVAGWFISRAYVMTLFIYGGMVQVLYRMALDQGLVPERMKLPRVMRFSAVTAIILIAMVYVMLRLQNLMRH